MHGITLILHLHVSFGPLLHTVRLNNILKTRFMNYRRTHAVRYVFHYSNRTKKCVPVLPSLVFTIILVIIPKSKRTVLTITRGASRRVDAKKSHLETRKNDDALLFEKKIRDIISHIVNNNDNNNIYKYIFILVYLYI